MVLCGGYKMSYRAFRFLTLISLFSALIGTPLAAQRDVVKRELEDLASPVAIERTRAIARLATIQEDIAADLRVAYKFSDLQERLGLLKAAQDSASYSEQTLADVVMYAFLNLSAESPHRMEAPAGQW